jgi:alkylglycerol monooxygenase
MPPETATSPFTLSTAWIAALIAAGLGFVALEAAVARRRAVRIHSPGETATALGCGALRLLSTVAIQGTLLGIYEIVSRHAAVVRLDPAAPLTVVMALVAYDFVFYWTHRLSHRNRWMWAAHAVHHQSKDFNLTLGVRVGVLAPVLSFPFELSLAVLGVPSAVFLFAGIVHMALMFWVHARFVRRLGPLELVFNTPAHHRVHHSADRRHSDGNFGGILILWDRVFGTFREHRGQLRYGMAAETPPAGPLEANLLPIARLLMR